jgi:hypothetical protein
MLDGRRFFPFWQNHGVEGIFANWPMGGSFRLPPSGGNLIGVGKGTDLVRVPGRETWAGVMVRQHPVVKSRMAFHYLPPPLHPSTPPPTHALTHSLAHTARRWAQLLDRGSDRYQCDCRRERKHIHWPGQWHFRCNGNRARMPLPFLM